MDETMLNMILSELQETRKDIKQFRTEVSDWKVDFAAQLAEHDAKIKDISGNGQPGRMADAEEDIKELKQSKYWVIGWASGISGLVVAAFELIKLKAEH